MNFDLSVVLEAVLGSALGAGATFVGIWFLFFKARVEHLQAISAPNLAKELQGVSQMLDQSVKEKQELEQQFTGSLKRLLSPKVLEGPINDGIEYWRLSGKAAGAFEAAKGLAEIIQNHIAAAEAGAEPRIPTALWGRLSKHMRELSELVSETLSAADLKAKHLLAELDRIGRV